MDHTPASLTWVPWPFLEKEKVEPWSDMPVWIPAGGPESGMSQVSIARALEAGLRFRPLRVTAQDTLTWWNGLPPERRAKLRAVHPRDLVDQLVDIAKYMNVEPRLTKELIDRACQAYFVEI